MNKELKIVKLPVSYSATDSFDSERFMKLRVKVMHTGLNLNNSNFSLAAIEKARPTLANIPLLAFIKKTDGDSNADFAGHEYEIKITEDDIKYVYLGRPIGIVPETNNYAVETDEEGKTFVVVDAYVWKDYANSALDILNRDEVKKVSMEINVNDYEWQDDYSYVDINDYAYTGIALLGEDVREAMIGAQAEVVKFSVGSITSMLAELKAELANFTAEPEVTVDESVTKTTEPEDFSSLEEPVEPMTEPIATLKPEDFDSSWTEPETEMTAGEEAVTTVEPIIENNETIKTNEFEIKINELETQNKEYEQLIAELKNENAQLLEFKLNIEKAELNTKKEELFNAFDDLTEEEIAPLKEADFSLEELEIRLFALRGQKVSVIKPVQKLIIDTAFGVTTRKAEPIYADLVKKRIQN
jgi:hypothetical protein